MKFICTMNGRPCAMEMTYKPDIKREVNGEILKIPREIIKFDSEGRYETDDPKKIEFIKRHVDFGNGNICVDESERFQNSSPEEDKIIEKHKGRPKKSA